MSDYCLSGRWTEWCLRRGKERTIRLLPNILIRLSILRMRILRLIFTSLLSLAILSVGSAAVAMAVNSPCPMMKKQAESAESDIAMASMPMMDMDDQNSMPDMDCMKAEKAHSSNALHCKSGQDCVMYNVQLANPASNIVVAQPKPQYLNSTHYIALSSELIPMPDLYGLWRPPRAL